MEKVGIITAMKEEAEHIIKKYNLENTKNLDNIKIYENDNLILLLGGIGKIQSSISTSYLLLNYKIKKLINIGIAGNANYKNAKIGDVFFITKIHQHDMYLPFDGEHLNYAKKEINLENNLNIENNFDFNLKIGTCLTGDQFVDDENKVLELQKKYNGDVIEMEAFSVASTTRELFNLDDLIIIKAISDGADNEAKDAHMTNLDFAMNNSILVLDEVLKNIN